MTDQGHTIARKAARRFARRDRLMTSLRTLDAEIQRDVSAYGQAVRTWGFTALMLRQACEARGLLPREE